MGFGFLRKTSRPSTGVLSKQLVGHLKLELPCMTSGMQVYKQGRMSTVLHLSIMFLKATLWATTVVVLQLCA
jgi:hypothetical protein